VKVQVVTGDLLDQDVDVIVNAWNRNVIPWWLLLPQGVSRAIKRTAGYGPFRELARAGSIPLGGAVVTGAGRLPYKAIIHVAGINLLWRSSERSIRGSVRSAIALAQERGFGSIAFPLIGAGTGGRSRERVQAWMLDELSQLEFEGEVRLVRLLPPVEVHEDPATWRYFHDGYLVGARGSVPGTVVLEIEIPYLRAMFRGKGIGFVVTLRGCSRFEYHEFDEAATTDLAEIASKRPQILDVKSVDPVVIGCTEGTLRPVYEEMRVSLKDGDSVTEAELDVATERYWDEWKQKQLS